jgi:hypothetical protein
MAILTRKDNLCSSSASDYLFAEIMVQTRKNNLALVQPLPSSLTTTKFPYIRGLKHAARGPHVAHHEYLCGPYVARHECLCGTRSSQKLTYFTILNLFNLSLGLFICFVSRKSFFPLICGPQGTFF